MQKLKTFDARVRRGLRLAQGGCGCGASGGCGGGGADAARRAPILAWPVRLMATRRVTRRRPRANTRRQLNVGTFRNKCSAATRLPAAKLTRDEARRIAANIAKLPGPALLSEAALASVGLRAS
jgi:hypothetical protein